MSKIKIMLDKQAECYSKNTLALYQNRIEEYFETRDRSWENCHSFFNALHDKYQGKKFEQIDKSEQDLSLLHLGYYLASWGMFRNSFLMNHDYNIFKNCISIMLDSKYNDLWNLKIETIKNDKESVLQSLMDLRNKLNKELSQYRIFNNTKSILIRKSKDESEVSQTLITKIMLGVLACCPAYDQYFISAVETGIKNFHVDSKVSNLLDFVVDNKMFEELSKEYNLPIMKVVDIVYFQKGIEEEFKNLYNTYIAKNVLPTKKEDLQKLTKAIRTFYYKTTPKANPTVNVAFEFDKQILDSYIAKNKSKLEGTLFELVAKDLI